MRYSKKTSWSSPQVVFLLDLTAIDQSNLIMLILQFQPFGIHL